MTARIEGVPGGVDGDRARPLGRAPHADQATGPAPASARPVAVEMADHQSSGSSRRRRRPAGGADRLGGVGHDPARLRPPRPPWAAGAEVDGQDARPRPARSPAGRPPRSSPCAPRSSPCAPSRRRPVRSPSLAAVGRAARSHSTASTSRAIPSNRAPRSSRPPGGAGWCRTPRDRTPCAGPARCGPPRGPDPVVAGRRRGPGRAPAPRRRRATRRTRAGPAPELDLVPTARAGRRPARRPRPAGGEVGGGARRRGGHGGPQVLDPLAHAGAQQLVVGHQLVGQDVAELVGHLDPVDVELVLDHPGGRDRTVRGEVDEGAGQRLADLDPRLGPGGAAEGRQPPGRAMPASRRVDLSVSAVGPVGEVHRVRLVGAGQVTPHPVGQERRHRGEQPGQGDQHLVQGGLGPERVGRIGSRVGAPEPRRLRRTYQLEVSSTSSARAVAAGNGS